MPPEIENTDHDILIALKNDMGWLKTQISNHLKHHFAMTLAAFGSALTAIIALVVVILKFK